MMTQSFTIEGSSVKLLKPGERGIVSRISAPKTGSVAQKLRSLNIKIGTTLIVEELFPRFMVRVGSDRHALSDPLRDALYVRL